jgi:hypothetical protein
MPPYEHDRRPRFHPHRYRGDGFVLITQVRHDACERVADR